MPKNAGEKPNSGSNRLTYIALAVVGVALIISALFRAENPTETVKNQSQEQLHSAVAPVRFNQGDKILIGSDTGDRSVCTVGYVDKPNNRLYTARHCLRDENIAYDANNQPIGKGYPVGDNDVAVIELDGPAQGENKHSTDNRPIMPQVGDQVCGYGSTSQRDRCGQITKIKDDGSIYASADVIGTHGDSGGPVWEKDTGQIIGVYRGAMNSTYSNGVSEKEALVEYFN